MGRRPAGRPGWRLAGAALAAVLAAGLAVTGAAAQNAPAPATGSATKAPATGSTSSRTAKTPLTPTQVQTLADVKAELAVLARQVAALKAQLVQTGAATGAAGGGDALQRMDAIEAELTRLTATTEEVDLRLRKVVADATNRIGDIEFRICDMQPGCDPSKLPPTPELGGAAAGPEPAPGAASGTASAGQSPGQSVGQSVRQSGSGDLAVNEQSDFNAAKKAFDAGDYAKAAAMFATFAKTYTGGKLTQQALVLRGDALDKSGDIANSARAYLQAFSGQPTGPFAGKALTRLGQQLAKLGQRHEACVTLTEVGRRFPGTPDADNAMAAMQAMGCP